MWAEVVVCVCVRVIELDVRADETIICQVRPNIMDDPRPNKLKHII